ncbi:MAG: undecaprenyl-diphosphate phosphatase [Lachnospiraceae bacterium]|nr:undecaprenyl-diphosphate phosphatase [Lachnospiraceae bacterium]
MTLIQAILLGLVQGLTEFLPVSSSGHLALMKNLLRVNTDAGILFDILLHVATLISVCAVMHKDIIKLALEFIGIVGDVASNVVTFFANIASKNEKGFYRRVITSSYRKFAVLIIVSSVPTAILGYLLKDIIETVESELLVPGICLIITGVILLISDFISEGTKKPKEATNGDAFSIGVAQGIATLPGISRSGITITACLLCGFDRRFAVKYSFIMSIPAILGALLLELKDIGGQSSTGAEVGMYVVGMFIAAVVGFFALKLTNAIVQKKSFKYFAFYCLGIGAVSVIAYIIKF